MHAVSAYLAIAAPYTAAGAFILALAALAAAMLAHRRLRALRLTNGDSLEETIVHLAKHARDMQQFRNALEEYLKRAETRLQTSVRGVGIIRFNPFHGDGSGGNQSFSAAFLNERGDGVVFSALHARAGHASVYAKPLVKGSSTFELTEEEREAIGKAMDSTRQALPGEQEK